jgi:hypothetical protein
MNIDGSDRSAPLTALGDKERDMAVLWSFGDRLLLGKKRSEDPNDYSYVLTYYDARQDNVIWSREFPFYTDIQAISYDNTSGEMYALGMCAYNPLRYVNVIISIDSGQLASATTSSEISGAIGLRGGYFCGTLGGKIEVSKDNWRSRLFLLKLNPRFDVVRYGILSAGCGLEKMKELRGYVWGVQKACTLAGNCYPIVTPIYDMRGGLSSDQKMDLFFSRRVDPVILEGYWFIYEMNDQYVTLVGQLDRKGGVLRMIRTKRGDIGL